MWGRVLIKSTRCEDRKIHLNCLNVSQSILFTGGSSFTGCHIARALAESGFSLVGTRTGPKDPQDPLVARIKYSKILNWEFDCPSSGKRFHELVSNETFKVWIQHGAPIKGYRNIDFDYLDSARKTLEGLPKSLEIFAKNGGQLVVHSGTIFEPNEGGANPGLDGASSAQSPYGVYKSWVWQSLKFWCEFYNLRLVKIVIPNPIGPFENSDRLLPVFYRKWLAKEVPDLVGSDLVRDNLPAPWLAQVYVDEVKSFFKTQNFGLMPTVKVRRPSGFVMKQIELIEEFKLHLEEVGGSGAGTYNVRPAGAREIASRVNSEPVDELLVPHKHKEFWTAYIEFLKSTT